MKKIKRMRIDIEKVGYNKSKELLQYLYKITDKTETYQIYVKDKYIMTYEVKKNK